MSMDILYHIHLITINSYNNQYTSPSIKYYHNQNHFHLKSPYPLNVKILLYQQFIEFLYDRINRFKIVNTDHNNEKDPSNEIFFNFIYYQR